MMKGKAVVFVTWDDAPHLSEADKTRMLAEIPAHQRDARSKGIPQLGSGAIYPVPEAEFTVEPFEIPKHWTRSYGLDVGWNRTAAVWSAWDREQDVVYLYSEHYRGEAEPSVHAEAIKSRGVDVGVIDPAANGRAQADGQQLLELYRRYGLNLTEADNGVESGIYEVWSRLSTGRMKVVGSAMPNWLEEYRIYRRDESGKVVKTKDHLMDATRYNTVSGLMIGKPMKPKLHRRRRKDRSAWAA